jgi:6-phosphofructokinase 1
VETARSLGIYLGEELNQENIPTVNPNINNLKPFSLETIAQIN